jgi:hypothetical protein
MFATVRCRRLILNAVALLFAIAHLGATDAPGKPQRIVSLNNMCVDEASVCGSRSRRTLRRIWLSRDPKNLNVAELGARHPGQSTACGRDHPSNPDLIIAGIYTTDGGRDVEACRHSGIGIGVPRALATSVRRSAKSPGWIGERRGESVVADTDGARGAAPHRRTDARRGAQSKRRDRREGNAGRGSRPGPGSQT